MFLKGIFQHPRWMEQEMTPTNPDHPHERQPVMIPSAAWHNLDDAPEALTTSQRGPPEVVVSPKTSSTQMASAKLFSKQLQAANPTRRRKIVGPTKVICLVMTVRAHTVHLLSSSGVVNRSNLTNAMMAAQQRRSGADVGTATTKENVSHCWGASTLNTAIHY